jgi:REP element-mobilizing transposase RayT
MAKFRNKYRIESARLQGYDYSKNGAYFITICTKNRICLFGEITVVETGLRPVSTDQTDQTIQNDILIPEMILSDAGKIISYCWFDLPNHYCNIILDAFIIMPNHIHGIIIIQNQNGRNQKHGISEFIRAFKSFSSRRINEIQKTANPGIWQPRFHDHIIRSEGELNHIRLYIKNNIVNWLYDVHFNGPEIK